MGETTVEPDSPSSQNGKPLEQNLKQRSTWRRLLFMLLFLFLWGVSRVVTAAVVLIQFLWVLFTGQTNEQLLKLGQGLATYSYQIVLYLTFNSDQRPFPFTDWPEGPPPRDV